MYLLIRSQQRLVRKLTAKLETPVISSGAPEAIGEGWTSCLIFQGRQKNTVRLLMLMIGVHFLMWNVNWKKLLRRWFFFLPAMTQESSHTKLKYQTWLLDDVRTIIFIVWFRGTHLLLRRCSICGIIMGWRTKCGHLEVKTFLIVSLIFAL